MLSSFIDNNSMITLVILAWLSVYMILTFWIYIYKTFSLSSLINKEKESIEFMFAGSYSVRDDSALKLCAKSEIKKEFLDVCKGISVSKATSGLSLLSIISSTSPFIGLFGTVVSILETFSKLGESAGIGIIAPAISEALVATAAGILVAIPAYSFYILIQRKAREYESILSREINIMLSRKV